MSFGARLKAAWRAMSFGLTDVASQRAAFPSTNASGKTVTFGTALQVSTVWACARLIAETIASLPLVLYKIEADGSRAATSAHPLSGLLRDSPNADLTGVEFWEGVALCLCLGGNSFNRKEYSGSRLVALTPLAYERVTVKRTAGGAREYHYTDAQGRHVYGEDEIFHVRGFGAAGDVGLSPVAFARQSIGSALAADEFAAAMMANGARPSGLLTVDQVLKDEQRAALKKNIVEPFVGSDLAGGVMILEAGMKFSPVTMTMVDQQFLQSRQFQVEELCRWFRVPPFMVGHTSNSTSWGTGLEQQMLGFLTFALRPYLARIEQSIRRSLMTPVERLTLKAEFNVEGLLRADSAARASFYQIMVQNGIYTRNEVRHLENRAPMDGADELTVQSQNVPLGTHEPPKKLPLAANA